jgi:hypothetical protein
MKPAPVLTIVLLLAPVLAQARDLFVDNLDGDDRNNGTSQVSAGRGNGPVRSLTRAVQLAYAGDRIHVKPNEGEPYRECITFQGRAGGGAPGSPVEVFGNGAVLDGSLSLMNAEWEVIGKDLFATRPPKMSFQQLFLNGQAAPRVPATASELPRLEPRQWCLYQGRFVFRTDPGRLPTAYHPSCCGHPVAVTLYDVHDVVIRDFVIRGYQLDGVNAHDTATRIDLVGIDSSFNGCSGFSIGGASRVRLEDCRAAGNGAAQVRTEGFSHTQIAGGVFDEAGAAALAVEGGDVTRE